MIQNSLSSFSLAFLTEGGSHFIKTSSPRGEAKMSITSDEVNFLVYRYLQESGKRVGFLSVGISSSTCYMQSHQSLIDQGYKEKSEGGNGTRFEEDISSEKTVAKL